LSPFQSKSAAEQREFSLADVTAPSHVFVLIHGTFARGAAWTGDDSKLVATLRDSFPLSNIRRFLWTGHNSHAARLLAADQLRDEIEAIGREIPQAKLHLISHSHGGNVALYALREHKVAQLVASLVCISTPFIICSGRDAGKLYVRCGYALNATLIPLVVLACYYVGVRIGAVGLTMLAGNLVVFFGLPVILRRVGPRIVDRMHDKQEAIVDRLDLGQCNLILLAARVARDEAALWLRAGYLISRLPHLVNLLGLLLLFGVVITVIAAIFLMGPLAKTPVQEIYSNWLKAALIALASFGLIVVTTLITRSHPFAFGWEGIFDGLLVDLDAGRTPNFKVVEQEFRIPRGLRLRHSALYADERFIQFLPQWVNLLEQFKNVEAAS
jgi:pimeloyl-ACP methyl ester carboxylesterase